MNIREKKKTTLYFRKKLNILRSVFSPPENIIYNTDIFMREDSKTNAFLFNEIVIFKFNLS